MKTILALIGGGDRDEIILRTAYAAAVPLGARLNLLHVHVSAGITLYNQKHAQFAMGVEMERVLRDLETRSAKYQQSPQIMLGNSSKSLRLIERVVATKPLV